VVNTELKNAANVATLAALLQKRGATDSLLGLYLSKKITAAEFFDQKRAMTLSGK
jgi:hypothetical protein